MVFVALRSSLTIYPVQDLRTLETSQLIDLLAKYTADYTRMKKGGISEEEYAKCNLFIRAAQKEINYRKRLKNKNLQSMNSTPPDFM